MKRFYNTGKALQLIRGKLKMTQKQLGKALNCNSQFISNTERGICALPKPSMKKLKELIENNNLSHQKEYFCEQFIHDKKIEAQETLRKWEFL